VDRLASCGDGGDGSDDEGAATSVAHMVMSDAKPNRESGIGPTRPDQVAYHCNMAPLPRSSSGSDAVLPYDRAARLIQIRRQRVRVSRTVAKTRELLNEMKALLAKADQVLSDMRSLDDKTRQTFSSTSDKTRV
jgi:hypothetical protein